MSDQAVTVLTAGLVSRVNDLAAAVSGDACQTLLQQQDQLSDLMLATIARDLDAQAQSFDQAVVALHAAIDAATAAQADLKKTTDAIDKIAKAIAQIGALLG
jgi:hypothetical protein